MHRKIVSLAAASLFALASTYALAHPPIAERPAQEEAAAFEADRADILAMAGNFKVRFDMQEATPWQSGYAPLDRKISGGHEVVRVIEDSGRRIVLQHILVSEIDGKPHITKHWRQDWEYEPARVLVYSDRNAWTWEDVPEKMRRGRWSQPASRICGSRLRVALASRGLRLAARGCRSWLRVAAAGRGCGDAAASRVCGSLLRPPPGSICDSHLRLTRLASPPTTITAQGPGFGWARATASG